MYLKTSADVKISTFCEKNMGMKLWITKWPIRGENCIQLNYQSDEYPLVGHTCMCYNLAGSIGSREHWLWDIARKWMNPSIAQNFGTTSPIQMGVSEKCTYQNEHFNQIENWKCHLFDFRLISLDCITYDSSYVHVKWNSSLVRAFNHYQTWTKIRQNTN